MKTIKLIVNYSYQKWNVSSYIYPKCSTILTFKNVNEISDDSILEKLRLKHDIFHIDIHDIKQIN